MYTANYIYLIQQKNLCQVLDNRNFVVARRSIYVYAIKLYIIEYLSKNKYCTIQIVNRQLLQLNIRYPVTGSRVATKRASKTLKYLCNNLNSIYYIF